MRSLMQAVLIVLIAAPAGARAELPPVPVPPENPITEDKRVLGKILFWDEQLSSNDTVACGTCHLPAAGGSDPRRGIFPGSVPGTVDDVAGSPGIRRLDRDGNPVDDPVFGANPQVTPRTSPAVFGALWASEVFWDGRAGGRLTDPVTGQTVIAEGAALENQALATLLNDAEMAKEGRTWDELEAKLGHAAPLALADEWPADVSEAIARRPTYPELFQAAFGDDEITAVRIVMAIASYQRTLVPDQTPWDRFRAGDEDALGLLERYGWQSFQTDKCQNCHEPPLFTSNDFINIGLRRSEYDAGRAGVSGLAEDAGDMKIPSLRNVGLRPRFMHTGEFRTLGEAINFYRDGASLPDVDEIPNGGAYNFSLGLQTAADLQSFLANALTDPRVAAETFPFDRPRLASERQTTVTIPK
jgi:cytochrome c peroxidase